MNGFVVSDRVPRAAPRLVRARDGERGPETDRRAGALIELADIRTDDPWRDRLASLRDRWSELTFYLFDPQSWR
jgi:hypothetical protein